MFFQSGENLNPRIALDGLSTGARIGAPPGSSPDCSNARPAEDRVQRRP